MLLLLQLLLLAAPAVQALSFGSMFGRGAVLQQGVPVAVWGSSSASGRAVELALDGKPVAKASVQADGSWSAQLPPQPTSWGRTLSASDASGGTAHAEVRFGAVVLCSGQSNMQMPVHHWDPCCDQPPAARDPEHRCSCFAASNGSAEVAAAGRYTDKISLTSLQTPFPKPPGWRGDNCPYPWVNASCMSYPMWNEALPGANGTVHGFSALCWYTGVALYQQLAGAVPVGLLAGSVGGSPIEFWLPLGHVNSTAACGVDDPPCDPGGPNGYTDSEFFERLIQPFAPYTVGAVVWDQAERDVHCLPTNGVPNPTENTVSRYACMEKQLVDSWRAEFNSSFAFVAIQLPGYLGDCGTYEQCLRNVFPMRLQQERPLLADPASEVCATYDLSCPFGVKTDLCPFGSVHNVNKRPIGARVAAQLRRLMLKQSLVTEGPRVASVRAERAGSGSLVTVRFTGTAPFELAGTQNCAVCCGAGNPASNDFDASSDGLSWTNSTGGARLTADGLGVAFHVPLAQPTHVRYTANQAMPQCALYSQERLPALPFVHKLKL